MPTKKIIHVRRLGIALAAIMAFATSAQAQSKVTALFSPDGGLGDPRNCSYYLTDNLGWVAVDMTQPNAAKQASDITFWATVGATINFAHVYNGICGLTTSSAWVNLPLLAQ